MNTILQRTLKAYRPLCQRGLLMDGQYKWPLSDGMNAPEPSARAARTRKRMLLVALIGLCQQGIFRHRSKS